MKAGPTVYRERTWAPAWAMVALAVAFLLSVGSLVNTLFQHGVLGQPMPDESLSPLGVVLLASGVLIFFVAMTSLFMCLDVEVRSDHLFVAFGPVHLVRKRIRYRDIESVVGVTYRPIREFGGWGIRPGRGKTAWTIRGNQAVIVTLRSGKEVYVGSRFPQRLAGRVKAAIGVR